MDRRISDCAPHVAFLDLTFLTKVAPIHGEGSAYRRQFWTSMIGKCADSQIGTARKTAITPHFAPGHWCCATADMISRRLVYYDPLCSGQHRTGALDALSAYLDQVSSEQGGKSDDRRGHVRTQIAQHTPQQPDNVSCGVCVLNEVQRTGGGDINSRRDSSSDVAELMRYRAKRMCELLINPTPTLCRSPNAAAGRRTARRRTGEDDVEMNATRPPKARKRTHAPLDDPEEMPGESGRPPRGIGSGTESRPTKMEAAYAEATIGL